MKKSRTNPVGTGTVNIVCNVPEHIKKSLEKLAAASGVSFSEYLRAVLVQAVSSNLRVEEIGKRLFLRDNITEYRVVTSVGKSVLAALEREAVRAAVSKPLEG